MAEETPSIRKTDELIAKILKELHAPGAALAVVDEEKTCITKPFTAAAASLLVNDEDGHGDITWETPMSGLISEDFVLTDDYATKHATLEDCLSHPTGIATHHADLGTKSMEEKYSNHVYMAVSLTIEKKTKQPLARSLRNRLWQPLSLETTFLGIQDAYEYKESHPEVQLAGRHMWDGAANSFRTLPDVDYLGLSGAGAMVSNVADCADWIRAFIEQKGPLSTKGYEALTGAHMMVEQKSSRFTGPVCYGLGWYVAVSHGERVLYHLGGLSGSVASLIILPDRITSKEVLDAAMWHIIEEHLGVPEHGRTDFVQETSSFPLVPSTNHLFRHLFHSHNFSVNTFTRPMDLSF
ncbi:hypothetical protein VPNG_06461 [Cytospora leucostoma]|uniref:Beta-lactamase-related domain-containing protein n=1 Tax=Cytospora leucostoma TaxID=1230097 RepID=A0A423WYW0_9PEZI|nr:hypothetical protein VPNG_06461 [Cytospora leucostoma]